MGADAETVKRQVAKKGQHLGEAGVGEHRARGKTHLSHGPGRALANPVGSVEQMFSVRLVCPAGPGSCKTVWA